MDELLFLKLGGSLITDKTKPYTVRPDKLAQLCNEIASALSSTSSLRLVLGHGSGSFGHYAVKEHLAPLRLPPNSKNLGGEKERGRYWRGFAEVWYRAAQLNRFVMEALHEAQVPAISLAPSAMVSAAQGIVTNWDLASLKATLAAGLVPVIYGDIVFDAVSRGSILSTEALMSHLAQQLPPRRILLAGLEAAVWADFPARRERVEKVTPANYDALGGKIGGSHGTDVTGGMRSKVEEMLKLVQRAPELSVQIFSGEEPGNIEKTLRGQVLGTLIEGD